MRRSFGVLLAASAAAAGVFAPAAAHAFCGFYINGAGATLYNNATLVVLMREGTRTVLSMQNNYAGPPEDFAMVVPVPVVLKEANVKTLPREVFERVDKLAAPRLVEYWEVDPCAPPLPPEEARADDALMGLELEAPKKPKDLGVTIEASFVVGEYKIVILSAKDSTGLDTWLRTEGYKIPGGAEPVLRPYVAAGSKFFVAKVDITKVVKKDGRLTLSPLRFYYDTDDFTLPVRLGLVNSAGTQDLIVHILGKGTRYEVANYPNVTVPTNFDVAESARDSFGSFYAELLDETMRLSPKAVVTEYAWDAGTCDPCPEPALTPNEIFTLGGDVLPSAAKLKRMDPYDLTNAFVLTRLHARYTKDSLGEDLIFRTASPIVGGRETTGKDGKLEKGARPDSFNNFQARYAIRHAWKGAILCKDPRRGLWGGPWADAKGGGGGGGAGPAVKPALDTAFAARGKVALAGLVLEDVPELGLKGPAGTTGAGAAAGTGTPAAAGTGAAAAAGTVAATAGATAPAETSEPEATGCRVKRGAAGPLAALALGLVALACALARRRR